MLSRCDTKVVDRSLEDNSFDQSGVGMWFVNVRLSSKRGAQEKWDRERKCLYAIKPRRDFVSYLLFIIIP